jgi:sugar O-acyltransferase (sialic acid O-acetyltransferase NeuD family)
VVEKIIFWGASGHAKVLRELVERQGYELIAVFDNNPDIAMPFPDLPVYVGMEGFRRWRQEREGAPPAGLVAIGGARGLDRVRIQRQLAEFGVRPVTAVHPTAFVAENAVLGCGTQVLANAAVCVEVTVGEGCILNTKSSVDHEGRLGDGVHLAPGATLTGCVSVGDYTLIGPGAVVLPRVRIGSNVIIGAGSVVTRDIPDGVVAFGAPARVQRNNLI